MWARTHSMRLHQCTTKLRFIYLQYYSIAYIIDELNAELKTNFSFEKKWVNDLFRNAMAHYKIGIALKNPDEIVYDDPFFGLTQKFLNCNSYELKERLQECLSTFVLQLADYHNLQMNKQSTRITKNEPDWWSPKR